jgi:pilus assembly protein CpaF
MGMALSERLRRSAPQARILPAPIERVRRRRAAASDPLQELKARIHRRLVERLDLGKLAELPEEEVRRQVRRITDSLLTLESTPLSRADRERLIDEIENETFGLGPLEPLVQDHEISDILVNGAHQVYVERFGRIEPTDVVFRDDAHLRQIIDRIVSRVGRRIDESSPMVDARLADGSRVNAIIPPLALDGPVLSIRRFGLDPLRMDDLLELGTITPEIAALLEGCVQAKLNILISGGTGAGKTTLLNVLSGFIPEGERVVTIEDSAELQLQQEHVVRLETRPTNFEGRGEVTQRALVRNALRMRPDRIIVGEVRGDEALDMLQAMNTGHDGSITTLHANSPRDALSRLETMILMAGIQLPARAMREQISSAIQVVIQVSRLTDGNRKLVSVSEIVGMEGDIVTMQDIFVFERLGVSPHGEVLGRFRATGVRPAFADRIEKNGFALPPRLFELRAGEASR